MSHENKAMRLTGDVYAFRIVAGVEQAGLGPLNANVLAFQPQVETVDIPDKRRGRRGQLMRTFTDASPSEGTLTLYSVPPKILSMLLLGSIVARNDAGGTVSDEAVAVTPDYWAPLAQKNVSSVVVDSGVQASLATGVELDNNALTWTAVTPGTGGNAITVTIVDPGEDATLAVAVSGTDITVTLGYGTGAITSTAAHVKAAIEASAAASALVSVDHTGDSTGAGLMVAASEANLTSGAASGGTEYTLGEDYELDDKLGLIRPISGGAITAATTVFASYTHSAVTGDRIEVGTDLTTRARLLLRGTNDADDSAVEFEAYSVVLTPSAEFDLLSDEPIQAEFAMKFETPSGYDHPIRLDFPTYASA